MNRKRQEGESFEDYRESQKADAERVKQHLQGKLIHISKYYIDGFPTPGNTYRKST